MPVTIRQVWFPAPSSDGAKWVAGRALASGLGGLHIPAEVVVPHEIWHGAAGSLSAIERVLSVDQSSYSIPERNDRLGEGRSGLKRSLCRRPRRMTRV